MPVLIVNIEQGGLEHGWVEFWRALEKCILSDFDYVFRSLRHTFSVSNHALISSVSKLEDNKSRSRIFRAVMHFLSLCSRHDRLKDITDFYHHFTQIILNLISYKSDFDQFLNHVLSYSHYFTIPQMVQIHQCMIMRLSKSRLSSRESPFSSEYANFFATWLQRSLIQRSSIINLLRRIRNERLYHTFRCIHLYLLTHAFNHIFQSDQRHIALSKYALLVDCSSDLGLFHKELPNKLCSEFYEQIKQYFLSVYTVHSSMQPMLTDLVRLSNLVCRYMLFVIERLLKDRQHQPDDDLLNDFYLRTCLTVHTKLNILALFLGDDVDVGDHITGLLVLTHNRVAPSRLEIIRHWRYSVLLEETSCLYDNSHSEWMRSRARSVLGCIYAQLVLGALNVLVVDANHEQSITQFYVFSECQHALLLEYAGHIIEDDQWQRHFEVYVESNISTIRDHLVQSIKSSNAPVFRQRNLPLFARFMQKISEDITWLSGVVQPFVLHLRFHQFFDFYMHSFAPFIRPRSSSTSVDASHAQTGSILDASQRVTTPHQNQIDSSASSESLTLSTSTTFFSPEYVLPDYIDPFSNDLTYTPSLP